MRHTFFFQSKVPYRIAQAILVAVAITAQAWGAINWDGGGSSNWWFDPENWSQSSFGLLPPAQDDDGDPATDQLRFTDLQVNGGSDASWDITGEGVVYDPDNDPFFAAAAGLRYPTGSGIADLAGGDFGPQHLYRFYLSRNTTNSNLVTIKSGDMWIGSTTIVGRSGSSAGNQNEGRVVQVGGNVRLPTISLDIGQSENSGWGNGVWDYQGGILEVSLEGGAGLRIAHGRSSGPSGTGRFIARNPESDGYVRTWDYTLVSYRGSDSDGGATVLDPNGVDRGVAYAQFNATENGTRPVQVLNTLTLNNGVELDTNATLSSRLDLVLDAAPQVDGSGVPIDMGLFDVDFDGDGSGVVRGFGDINDDGLTDAVLASPDGSTYYLEGDTVSADFGGTTYNWSISYTGDIQWANADTGQVSSISGPGTGIDVVLMGLSSVVNLVAGDMNGDSMVNFGDLSGFVLALTNPSEYDAINPDLAGTGAARCDANGDGDCNFGDLSAFVGLLTGGGAAANSAAVPEPSGLALLIAALCGCLLRRAKH